MIDKSELERVLNSKEFHELDRQISENNARYSELPRNVRATAYYLLATNQIGLIKDLWRLFYKRRIPTIEQFLSDEYLGPLTNRLYPKWKQDLIDIFSPSSAVYEIILSGAIGIGKTTVARIAHLYNLIKVLSLKNPQLTLNVTPDTLLVLSLFSITLEKAQLAIVKPFKALLEECSLFQEVRREDEFMDYEGSEITPYIDKGGYINFPNNIMIYAGSTVSHALCLTGDAKIRLVSGKVVPISELVSRNKFWVYSCDKEQRIIPGIGYNARKTASVYKLVKVTLDDGSEIKCTPDHRFMLLDGSYEEAQHLSPRTPLMSMDDTRHVRSVEVIDSSTPIDVYDITVEEHHNFVLESGVVVHNSFSLIGALLDESEFRRGGAEDAVATYTNLKERVRSRFLGSRFILLALVSSARYSTGMIAEYVNNIKPNDPNVKYMAYPIWEVKHFDAYNKGYFYVLRGTKTHPSRILDKEESVEYESGSFHIPPNCEVIKVPEIYRPDFEMRIEAALQNLAGVQTLSGDFLFDDLTNTEYHFLLREFNIEAPLGSPIRLIDRLPPDLFRPGASGRRLARYPDEPRFVHIDLAESSEGGLAMVHKEVDSGGNIKYVVDFVCSVTSPNRIDLDAIERLFIDLREEAQVNFEVISADQFQSTHLRQAFQVKGITKVSKHLSVDRSPVPYLQLSRCYHNKSVATGKSPKLLSQLSAIQLGDGHKIVTTKRKDVADALCGAIHNAISTPEVVPTQPFMDLIDIKIDTSRWKKL